MSGPAPDWWGRRTPIQRMAIVAACVVVAASTIALVAEARTPANSPTVNAAQAQAFRRGAYDACKGFVTDHLGAPATASFRDGSVQVVKGAAPREWSVLGAVDSEQGFGVALHQRFVCTMLTTDTGGWASERVALSP